VLRLHFSSYIHKPTNVYSVITCVGRNRYQLEIPESVVSRHAPEEYDLKSQKKGHRRYWTPTIEQLLQQLVDKETQRDDALKDTMRTIFHSFDDQYVIFILMSVS